MAKGSTSTPARTEAIDVVGADAVALAAAWRGLRHFLGGNVENWEVISPSADIPEGGIVAHGFSIDASHGVTSEQVVSSLGKKNRRLEFIPFYDILNGNEPPAFTDAQSMTNYMVQYLGGSEGDGTTKTPEYFRKAVQEYKAANNMRTRRGPKTKVLRLDQIDSLTPEQVRSIDPQQIQKLLDLALSAQGNTNQEVAASS